jgi:hypothetical protein
MLTIHKFPIPVRGQFTLRIGRPGTILAVQPQRDEVCAWAVVDPAAPPEERRFRIFGTGQPIAGADLERLQFLATVQVGGQVWHVFEDWSDLR